MEKLRVLKNGYFQLCLGEEYWKDKNDVIPERHSLFVFLLKNEYAYYGSELIGKEFNHFLISNDLISHNKIMSPGMSMNRQDFIDTLWDSYERKSLEKRF